MMSDFTDHIPQATTDPDDTAVLLCSCGWESHGGGGGDWWDHLDTTLVPHAVLAQRAVPLLSNVGALDAAICNHTHDRDAQLRIRSDHLQLITFRSCSPRILDAMTQLGWELVPRGELEKLRAENALWVPNAIEPHRDSGGGGVEEVIEDLWEAAYQRQHPQGTDIAPLPPVKGATE
jgi:hypothetical protein